MRKPLLAALLLTAAVSAGALNLVPFGTDVVTSAPEGERTTVNLRDSGGKNYTVSLAEDPSAAVAAQIVKLKDFFYSWRGVTVGTLRFTVTGGLVEAVLFPQSLVVGGSDLRSYVPAGLLFSWSAALGLQYDFRVTKSNLFMRVSGVFKSEEEMEGRIADALAHPEAYLQRGDTEYLLSRLDEAQKQIAALRASQAALEKSLDAARYAAMTAENVEWFTARPISRDGIARILALKQESSDLTWKEAAEKLKAEGITMTDKEIRIVFRYYYGE